MDAPWFSFSLPDFSYAFLSVLLEGVPFLLLGTLLSGLIDQFLPSRMMIRYLPKNAVAGVCLSGLMGILFPMCECGIVPVIRRLVGKGLPISNAIAYMLAAPIVNPIVALSTYAAFRGQNAAEFTSLRMLLGYLVAVIAALAVHNLPKYLVMRDGFLPRVDGRPPAPKPIPARLAAAMRVAVHDFLDVMVFFVLGVALSSLFSTSINQEILLPLALNDWLAVGSMMLLAAVLSLCSTSDAFIAATFVSFPAVSKMAFLVFGPMMDLKLLFIYSAVFRKRFVIGLAIGLFVLIGLACVRLTLVGL
jgi:hypothetical protein